jgi:hypothetical protein
MRGTLRGGDIGGTLRGHGEVQDFFELPQLNALNSVDATRRPSRPL